MQLADLVAASVDVASTSSRKAKAARIATLLATASPDDARLAARYLIGDAGDERLNVGYAAVADLDVAPASGTDLELDDVAAAFARLAEAEGPGSVAVRRRTLEALLGRADAASQAFLRRLLVGEVRHGALEGVMIDAIAAAFSVPAPTVRRAVMLTGDLGETAALAARDPNLLAQVGLETFRPVKPMLAKTASDLHELFADGRERSIEEKLDGVRLQIHRRGEVVRVYSRGRHDLTARLPGVVDRVLRWDVDEVIADAEGLALDREGRPIDFQDTMGRVGTSSDLPEVELQPFAFDILRAGGDDLLDTPLADRQQVLDAVVPSPQRVRRLRTADAATAARFLAATLDRGHEGVMVKDLDSVYAAGRRGAAWHKVKPVYTLDLVVLAAEWGSGRRRGKLSNLHLGARHGDDFVMLGKTFKGLTDEMLEWQTRRLLELETHREGHIVHVRPEQVVEVAIDGVQRSTRYPGGVTLRFARVRRYRDDKRAAEADTLDTVRTVRHRPREGGDGEAPPSRSDAYGDEDTEPHTPR